MGVTAFAGYEKYKDFFELNEVKNLSDYDFAKKYMTNISLFTQEQRETI